MSEHPRDRMARHFGLGEYGERLADEILNDYREMLADWLLDYAYRGAGFTLKYFYKETPPDLIDE